MNTHFNNKIRKLQEILDSTDHKYTLEITTKYLDKLKTAKACYKEERQQERLRLESAEITKQDYLEWLAGQRKIANDIVNEWEEER